MTRRAISSHWPEPAIAAPAIQAAPAPTSPPTSPPTSLSHKTIASETTGISAPAAPAPADRAFAHGPHSQLARHIAAFVAVVGTFLTGSLAIAAEFKLVVPAVIVAEPGKPTPLAIQITPADKLPPKSYIRVSGLHDDAKFSGGYHVTKGIWSIPLKALPALQLDAPVAAAGNARITIALVDVDGVVLAERQAKLVVAPAWLVTPDAAPPPPATTSLPAKPAPSKAEAPPAKPRVIASATAPFAAISPEPKTAAPPTPRLALSPATIERAQKLMEHGQRYLDLANFAVARQYFTRAAKLRYAPAALMLARTYDPAVVATLPVPGLTPNPDEARRWYREARQLGAPEAEAALTRIEQR